MVSVPLRAIDVRLSVLRVKELRVFVVGVRVAARDMPVAVRVVFGVVAVRDVVTAREVTFVVARGETSRVAVRDAFDVLVFARGTVVRSRTGCDCFVVALFTRETAFVFDDALGVLDFCRVDVTVFVAPRRVAARTASSDSFAKTLPIPSNARHTAKITLIPFILIWDSVANLRKSGQAKYMKNIRFLYDVLVRLGGIEPPRILSTASLVLRVYQFRHSRIDKYKTVLF